MSSLNFRIYVASISDYNSGTFHGVWIDFEECASSEDVQDKINSMLASSPFGNSDFAKMQGLEAEEWAIHAHETLGLSLNESENIEDLWEAYETLQDLEGDAVEPFCIWLANTGSGSTPDVEGFREAYCGHFDSEATFAEHIVDESDLLAEMPENLRYYFDYEAFGRDLFIGGEYWMTDGYVFRNI